MAIERDQAVSSHRVNRAPRAYSGHELAPEAARGARRFERELRRCLTDGWRDAGDMKPTGAGKHRRPIERRLGQRKRAAVAVVDHLRGTLACTGLEEIDPHATRRARNVRRVHAKALQFADRRVAKWIGLRQDRDKYVTPAQPIQQVVDRPLRYDPTGRDLNGTSNVPSAAPPWRKRALKHHLPVTAITEGFLDAVHARHPHDCRRTR